MSAPAANNVFMHSSLPYLAAQWSAVLPSLENIRHRKKFSTIHIHIYILLFKYFSMYSSLINCIFHYIYQMKYSYCELFSHFRRRFTQNLVIITSVSFLCIHVYERIYINVYSIFVINMLYV